MSFLERKKDGTYAATQNGHTIATGKTQAQAGSRAYERRPNDPILAGRVRHTDVGTRDKWRRLYPRSN